MINREIEKLIRYSIYNGLIDPLDEILIRNKVLEVLNIEEYDEYTNEEKEEIIKEIVDIKYPTDILDEITKWAGANGRLEEDILVYRDLLNSKIMGQIIERTSTITHKFNEKYKEDKKQATDYFYELSKQSNYIRTDRIKNNINYKHNSRYGELDITINLSKPEKDPKEIAKAKNAPKPKYPQSLLCKENVGYMGRINHPGRQNHRILKLNLTNEDWYFQYSPYIYYNEHSIVFSGDVRPMKIDKNGFRRLLEFIDIFPHYFIGSNADLPIVGGSILSHDHFQAGHYTFAMETAKIREEIVFEKYPNVSAGILDWAMSVIRLQSNDKEEILDLADNILNKWINYTNEENDIIAFTGEERHNTITPIARMKDGKYELDLVLRNNAVSDEYPLGKFHPHEEYHNIKKENIGLIEVMGLAVLPGRLKEEMLELDQLLMSSLNVESALEVMEYNDALKKHMNWIARYISDEELCKGDYEKEIRSFIGDTFVKVLEDCAVFKDNEQGKQGFRNFLSII